MSKTPRTDEAQFGTGRVSVDFARQLERELAEKTEAVLKAASMIDEWRNRARRESDARLNYEERSNQLERELAALTARFDRAQNEYLDAYGNACARADVAEMQRDESQACLREAMDAMIGTVATGKAWPERWLKAAGMEEG